MKDQDLNFSFKEYFNMKNKEQILLESIYEKILLEGKYIQ